jgi:DNA-binding FadR family transcriptional regulator
LKSGGIPAGKMEVVRKLKCPKILLKKNVFWHNLAQNSDRRMEPGMRQVDAALFKAEKPRSAVDIVIDTFRRLLINRELMPGDRLPAEIELANNLHVSRGSVREAMKVLSSYGVVQIERGNYTYVSKEINKNFFNILIFQLLLSEFDKTMLLELREMLEIGMVELVFAHATPEDFAEIRKVHERMEQAVSSGAFNAAELTKMDIAFHKMIARATANFLIEQIYDFILELFVPSIEKAIEKGEMGRNSVYLHRQILMGYESKDVVQTVSAVRQSIEQWYHLA